MNASPTPPKVVTKKPGTVIWVKSSFIGMHQWPDAPADVAYLKHLHRHVFNVRVRIPVKHADREIEFHIFKRRLDFILASVEIKLSQNPSMSCEMIAMEINTLLNNDGYNPSAIQVDEDGECGAEIYPST